MKNRYAKDGKVLAEINATLEGALRACGLSARMSADVAMAVLSELRFQYGGLQFYFPRGGYSADENAARLFEEFRAGVSVPDLAKKFDCSTRYVYKLLSQKQYRLDEIRHRFSEESHAVDADDPAKRYTLIDATRREAVAADTPSGEPGKRRAGRQTTVSDESKALIASLVAQDVPRREIARRFDVSLRYICKLTRDQRPGAPAVGRPRRIAKAVHQERAASSVFSLAQSQADTEAPAPTRDQLDAVRALALQEKSQLAIVRALYPRTPTEATTEDQIDE